MNELESCWVDEILRDAPKKVLRLTEYEWLILRDRKPFDEFGRELQKRFENLNWYDLEDSDGGSE